MNCESTITFCKAPGEVLDFTVDWSSWLSSETISTSDWTLTSGITEDSSSNTTTAATIWISGGANGSRYKVINTITTSANPSRTAQRAFYIQLATR